MIKLKAGESNFKEIAERYQIVVSNIKEAIIQLDPYGNILFINNSWMNLTGFNVEDSLGTCILDYIIPAELKGISSSVMTKVLSGEFYFVTQSLNTKIVEFSLKPIFNGAGAMDGYTGSITDVTERKQQETLIKVGKTFAETLNRDLEKRIHEEVAKNREKDHILIQQSRLAAMGEMIASIGHQWRQPLNNLSLLIQDVREAREFGEIDDHYIDQFTRESMIQIKHMSQTINDFRRFYRPNKEKTRFSLAESIEDALSIFSSSLKSHDIHVEFEYRGSQMAYGYPNEFSQVVLNILTNARDAFVHKGISDRCIKIRIIENADTLEAVFADNAGGIDENHLNNIFDPYFTTRPHGTGLGLYMARMILENMDGTATVVAYDNGASFSLIVPRVSTFLKPKPEPLLL